MNFFSLFKRKILYKIKKKFNIDNDEINLSNLDELFKHYGSDKSNNGHGFSNFYIDYLKDLKDKDINILEIGSYAGSSAAAFTKYLPRASIYCFDVNISKFEYLSKNIHVHGLDINNQNKVEKVIKFIGNGQIENVFDVIIDDGSHYLSDILFSLKILFKSLKSKGLYIIEDFKHPNYYDYNRDVDDILVDKMLYNIEQKSLFHSNILKNNDQVYLHQKINKIKIYKGNLKDSDICFIKRK